MKNIILSITNYKEKEVKEIIKKSKNLDKNSHEIIAETLANKILELTSGQSKTLVKILLFHAPSSSFARGDKKDDHMAKILEKIHDYLIYLPGAQKIVADICAHLFLIDIDKLESQHNKTKDARISDSIERFHIISPKILSYFSDFIEDYDYIYIIDDVSTTGSTFESLIETLKANLKPQKSPEIIGLAYCH